MESNQVVAPTPHFNFLFSILRETTFREESASALVVAQSSYFCKLKPRSCGPHSNPLKTDSKSSS